MRALIIGGVAGGMSAATRLRRLDDQIEIIVLEKSGFVLKYIRKLSTPQ